MFARDLGDGHAPALVDGRSLALDTAHTLDSITKSLIDNPWHRRWITTLVRIPRTNYLLLLFNRLRTLDYFGHSRTHERDQRAATGAHLA